jgi:hypothetical protein
MFEELLKKIREYISLKAQEKAFHDSCTGTHYGFPYQKIEDAEADFKGLLTKIIDERVKTILDAKEAMSQDDD